MTGGAAPDRGAAAGRSVLARSEEETVAFGEEIGRLMLPAGCLLLYGELGAGKTVLVRGVAAAAGVPPLEISSPTFTLIHEHRGSRADLVHADHYRLAPHEVAGTGLPELLLRRGLVVIEWAERLPEPPAFAHRVTLRRRDDESRELCREPPRARRVGPGDGETP